MNKPESQQRLADIRKVDGGLQITVRGDWVRNVNEEMIESCVSSLARCAGANRCLDGRIALTDACLHTLVGHNLQERCVEQSFGFAPKKGRAGAKA